MRLSPAGPPEGMNDAAPLLHVVRGGSRHARTRPGLRRLDADLLRQSGSIRSPARRSAARCPRPASCSSARPGATASRSSASTRPASTARRSPVHRADRLGAALLQRDPLRPRARRRRRAPAQAADRRADVGPLRHAAARHGRGLPAARTRSTSPTGSTPAWCRCREGRFDLDDYIDYLIAMFRALGPDAARHGGLPAVGAGARRRRPHGGRERPAARRARMTLMGGPIDTRRQPDRGQQARRGARHRLVPAQLHRQGAAAASGLHGATSIRASCSSPASWR